MKIQKRVESQEEQKLRRQWKLWSLQKIQKRQEIQEYQKAGKLLKTGKIKKPCIWQAAVIFLLVLSIVFSNFPVVPILASNGSKQVKKQTEKQLDPPALGDIIELTNASDLIALSNNCHVNSWSKGKVVRLMNDISLEGSDYEPVPAFSGTFEGNGYTISDFNLKGSGYSDGLFRYIEESGVVKDLKVTGNLTSQAEERKLGGIAGANAGLIENCQFDGSITGKTEIGGMAGVNEGSGTIMGCTVKGELMADYYLGGIAGKNAGVISDSQNYAGIDDNVKWLEKKEEEDSISTLKDLLAKDSTTKIENGMDIGGITGYSSGMIASCLNYGTVGYEHSGYNIGGIAGRQAGLITKSENHAAIYGRKDVGGIVGQSEPYIEIEEAESISKEIQKLHDLVDQTLDDMNETEGTLSDNFKDLQDHTDSAADEASDMADQASEFINTNIDSVNDFSDRTEYVIKHLPAVLEDADSAMDVMGIISKDLKRINKDMKNISHVLDQLDQITEDAGKVNTDLKDTDKALGKMDEITDDVQKVNDDLGEFDTVLDEMKTVDGDMKKVNNDLSELSKVYGKLDDIADDMDKLNKDLNILDQMKSSSYDETKYDRLSVVSGVGGTMTADNNNPAEGVRVTLTIKPEEGYELNTASLTAHDASKNTVSLQRKEENVYTFTMPKGNVAVSAEFTYTGRYLPASNEGGTVTLSETASQVRIALNPDSGYQVRSLSIGGTALSITGLENGGDTSINKAAYPLNKKPLLIYAEFEKNAASHSVSIVRSTGGLLAADQTSAVSGDTVTIYTTPASVNYELDAANLRVEKESGGTVAVVSSAAAGQYTFTMPNEGITISAPFRYVGSEDIHAESNPGGNVVVTPIVSNRSTITITPDNVNGYQLQTDSIAIKDGAGTEYTVHNADLTAVGNGYTYLLNTGGYPGGTPFTISAVFVKNTDTYSISTTDGTGGRVTSSLAAASAGALVNLSVLPSTGYRLKTLSVDGRECTPENNLYSFTMPAHEVSVTGVFEPVQLIVTSANAGGNARYTADGDKITVTVTPESGFTVDGNPVLAAANGTILNMQKKYADSFVYEFSLTAAQEPASFSVTFKRQDNYSTVKSSFDRIDENTKLLNGTMKDISNTLADLRGTMMDENGQIKDWNALSQEQQEEVVKDLLELANEMGEAGSESASIASDLGTAVTVIAPYLEEEAENANKDIQTIVSDFKSMVSYLRSVTYDATHDTEIMLDDLEKALNSTKDLSAKARQDLEAAITHTRELTDILDTLSDKVNKDVDVVLKDVQDLSDYLDQLTEDITKDTDRALDDFDNMTSYLQDASEDGSSIIDYLNSLRSIRFQKLGDGFDATCDNLYGEIKDISSTMREINKNMDHYTDVLVKDFKAVNDQLNYVLVMLLDRAEAAEKMEMEGTVYEDVSEDDLKESKTGKISSSVNYNSIKGDINVGGIAGSMAIDDNDPEDNAAGTQDISVGSKYLTKCVVSDCSNYGFITAKKDGAGGICGYMGLGIVSGCDAYGTASSIEGSYVGGICGQSDAVIQNCSSLCVLDGVKYVGGITGYGTAVRDCYSMAKVSAAEGRQGAIAGQIAYADNEDQTARSQKIYDNYYVSDDLFGIDEISYIGVAEPVTYEEILRKEKLPKDFGHLKITFVVEGEKLSEMEVPYGQKLAGIHYPVIPAKEGCYGEWPDLSSYTMNGNYVVEAAYKDNVTVLKSVEKADASKETSNSYAMAEGIFTQKNVLHAVERDIEPPDGIRENKKNRVEEVIIVGDVLASGGSIATKAVAAEKEDGLDESSTVVPIRLLNEIGEKAQVWKFENDSWLQIKSVQKGKYIQIGMLGERGIYCVATPAFPYRYLILAGAGGAAVLAVLVLLLRKRRKKRRVRPLDGQD